MLRSICFAVVFGLLTSAMCLALPVGDGSKVLILQGASSPDVLALQDYLFTYNVNSMAIVTDGNSNGHSPITDTFLAQFSTVVFMFDPNSGDTLYYDERFQKQLLNFVWKGGKFISFGETQFVIDYWYFNLMQNLKDLIPLQWENESLFPDGSFPHICVPNPKEFEHPVLAGRNLTESFRYDFNLWGAFSDGILRNYSNGEMATVLVNDEQGKALVGVRAFGGGKVVSFAFRSSARNFHQNFHMLTQPPVMQLIRHAIAW